MMIKTVPRRYHFASFSTALRGERDLDLIWPLTFWEACCSVNLLAFSLNTAGLALNSWAMSVIRGSSMKRDHVWFHPNLWLRPHTRIGVAHEESDGLEEGVEVEAGLPALALEQVEADPTLGVDVGVVDRGHELDWKKIELKFGQKKKKSSYLVEVQRGICRARWWWA